MPPKSKKIPDKDALWYWAVDTEPASVTRKYVEFVYKIITDLATELPDDDDHHHKTDDSDLTTQANGSLELSNSSSHSASSQRQDVHARCRKNCVSDPFCLAGLGFEKWASGDMDYDWPSDDEEDDCLVKRKKEVPVGLMNLGATCYVNAFLQLWYHNLAFRNAVMEWTHGQDGGYSICDSLQYIFGLLELSHRSCVDPSPLIETLGLDASQQQDAQEFSKLFIDLLPCPQIKEMFSGTYDYVTRCSSCKNDSCTPSQFNELDLSIEGLSTLDECIKSFLQVEKLTGDNQYFCSKCQSKQNATRSIKLRKLPAVLNIQLLRFVFDRKTGHKKKLNTCLQFTDHLDLTDIVSNDGPPEQLQYELTAVLMHSGVTAFSGHYTAHIRKQDSWYSFNDANVSKLKGKKLNLANEESLDVDPGGTAAASENRKKGHRSKNAYMLVYQNKAFIHATKDLQPSPVPELINQQVKEDNDKMTSSNHDMEIKQTEQMVRVEMKKDQIKELSDHLNVSDFGNLSENYHFIPVSWINDTMKDWGEIKPIDNRHLLCRHGKLNWSAHSKYKIISQQQGEMVYKTYSGDHTTILTRRDSLCYECVRNQMMWRRSKHKTEQDSKLITTLISSTNMTLKNTSHNSEADVRYWLSKSDLRRWKSLVLKPLERAAAPTDKTTTPKSEPAEQTEQTGQTTTENGEWEIMNGVSDTIDQRAANDADETCDKPSTVLSDCTMNGDPHTPSTTTSDSKNSENGDAEPGAQQTEVTRFNQDILCEHGNLDSSDKYRQLVSQQIWDILLHYFPDAATMTEEATPCQQCLGAQEVMEIQEVQRKSVVKEQRSVLCDLASLRNRPIISKLTTDAVYGLSVPAYKEWKQFLRNPNSSSSMESIDNSSIICPHDKLSVCLPDENSVVLLWPYEWDVLCKHFPHDQVIKVLRSPAEKTSEQNGGVPNSDYTVYTTEPGMCSECIQSRLLCEELESHHFDNAKIHIRLIDTDDDDKKSASVEDSGTKNAAADLNTTTTDDDEEPENKKVKMDPLTVLSDQALAAQNQRHKRRSGRRKHVRGDKQLRLSSDTTLKQLRVEIVKMFAIAPFDQILTLDGSKLDGDEKSLAELKLYPDCLILLQGKIYDDASIEQALVEQQVLEEGFRGTGLINGTNT